MDDPLLGPLPAEPKREVALFFVAELALMGGGLMLLLNAPGAKLVTFGSMATLLGIATVWAVRAVKSWR